VNWQTVELNKFLVVVSLSIILAYWDFPCPKERHDQREFQAARRADHRHSQTGRRLSRRILLRLGYAVAVGYTREISCDRSRPDATPQKLLGVSRLAKLGLPASTGPEDGVRLAYQTYVNEGDRETLPPASG
jgi:hypothetical protein